MVYDRVRTHLGFKFLAALAVLVAVVFVPLKEHFSPSELVVANKRSVADGFKYIDAGNGAETVIMEAIQGGTSFDGEPRTSYRVQEGDTFYSVSQKFGVSPVKLKTHNRLTTYSLSVGQVLYIPDDN